MVYRDYSCGYHKVDIRIIAGRRLNDNIADKSKLLGTRNIVLSVWTDVKGNARGRGAK